MAFIVGDTEISAYAIRLPLKADQITVAFSPTPASNGSISALLHTAAGPSFSQPRHIMRSRPSLVGNVIKPTLVVVGSNDHRTPMCEAEQYYAALKIRGIRSALVKVPCASRGGLPARSSQPTANAAAVIAWVDRHRRGSAVAATDPQH